MCGHDLRIQPRRRHRVAFVDVLMVLAVLAVLVMWWRIGSQPRQEPAAETTARAILPTNIPLLAGTLTPTPTPAPTATFTPVPTLPPQQTLLKHTVKAGETLLSIGAEYDVTVAEIQAANNLNDELIREGDELTIPVLRSPQSPTANSAGPTSQLEYTVKSDDTIGSIAENFGSSVNEILTTNNLSENDLIRPGDVLRIPVHGLPKEVLESTSATPQETKPVTPSETSNIGAIYIEPRLIGPPDGVTLGHSQAVLLRWISVDVLQPNEWYVLLIEPDGDLNAREFPSIWTKATSYRLAPELAPENGQAAHYRWRVTVVRVKPGSNGQAALDAASPPSLERRFIWQ
jgi:LysM repeat protein